MLVDEGIATPVRSQQVVEEDMLPLVGERQKIFEQNLDTMDVSFCNLFY